MSRPGGRYGAERFRPRLGRGRLLPAALVFYIRRYVEEPEIFNAARPIPAGGAASTLFAVFSREHIATTQGGYYAVATWLPTYLKVTRNLSVFNTGAYLFVIIIGAFVGFVIAAYLADASGRRGLALDSTVRRRPVGGRRNRRKDHKEALGLIHVYTCVWSAAWSH